MSATGAAKRWIRTTLTGDATLMALATGGVHYRVAPAGTTFPYVVFHRQGGRGDQDTLEGRVWTDATWLVKSIAAGTSTTGIEPIVNRVDVLLQRKSGSATGGTIVLCKRIDEFDMPEDTASGEHFEHLGALYRLSLSGA